MQVNTTKHQTLHDISPRQYNPYVNKSYYVNTELEDEYEDDMDEYTEDEDTEDEDTEEEYGRYEDTEDEDCKDKELDEEDDEVKYYWMHQVDDFIEQDPTWKGYDHNLLRLHPDNLKEFLEKQQKKGIFKPRNLSHVEWMKIDYIKRWGDPIQEQQQLLALLEQSANQSRHHQPQNKECQEDKHTVEEYTEDKYTEEEYTEDEDQECQEQAYKQEYNDSRQRGQGYQQVANQSGYPQPQDQGCQESASKQECQVQAYQDSGNQLGYQRSAFQPEYQDQGYHQSQDQECQELTYQQEPAYRQEGQAFSVGEIQNLLGSESGRNYLEEVLQ